MVKMVGMVFITFNLPFKRHLQLPFLKKLLKGKGLFIGQQGN